MNNELYRVLITKSFLGLCSMQVCAEKDATDEEILEVCNRENPSGTQNGWCDVRREVLDDSVRTAATLPVPCDKYPERLHFLVLC